MAVKVSVVIPTYNRKDLLKRAVASVLSQDMSDWEIVVIDDGSTDGTKETAAELMRKDGRIRYYYQENAGLPATRERSVSLTRGEYLCYLDDDDVYDPKKLRIQSAFLDAHPETGLVYSYVDEVDPEGNLILQLPVEAGTSFIDFVQENRIQVMSFMLRKKCLETVGPFNGRLASCDDYDLWLRFSRQYPIAFLPERVGKYYRSPKNMSSNKDKRYNSILSIYNNLLSQNLSPEEKTAVKKACAMRSYLHAVYKLEASCHGEASRLFLRALKYDPAVGTQVRWSKFSNILYRFIKPYFAVGACWAWNLKAKMFSKERKPLLS